MGSSSCFPHSHLPSTLTFPTCFELQHQIWRKRPFRGFLTSALNCIRSALIYPRGSASLTGLCYVEDPKQESRIPTRVFQMHCYFLEAPSQSLQFFCSDLNSLTRTYVGLHEACKKDTDGYLTDPPKYIASASTKPVSSPAYQFRKNEMLIYYSSEVFHLSAIFFLWYLTRSKLIPQ